jgi:hypothetical protein
LLFLFLLFLCFLVGYEHNEFLLLTTLTMFVVLLWVSFLWCASVVQWFKLDVNQRRELVWRISTKKFSNESNFVFFLEVFFSREV